MASDEATPALPGRDEPGFAHAIRRASDHAVLADLAATWPADDRPGARRNLLDYLDGPLDAPGHALLVKRLFKGAEARRDHEVMARFLVALDRSDRRSRTTVRSSLVQVHDDQGRADQAALLLAKDGYAVTRATFGLLHRKHRVIASRPEERVRRRVARPRSLFSLRTRNYLRRRAWRHFRTLARVEPGRYVGAIAEALVRYRDEDAADGVALLDNWGLVHALFGRSPALIPRPSGWRVAPGHALAELAPAPAFERLWDGDPDATLGLLARGRCRAVRRWAALRIEADPARFRTILDLEGWFDLLGHADPDVARLAAGMLDRDPEGLARLDPARWVDRIERAGPGSLAAICDLARRHVPPGRVVRPQALRLAGLAPIPAARLGLDWLGDGGGDDPAWLALLDARCDPLRPEILRRVRSALARSGAGVAAILAFLDSRHRDARVVGWAWFEGDPAAVDDVATWQQLLESPYADVRIALLNHLERRRGDGAGRSVDLRGLWAAVLLDAHRGGRAKPAAVAQILDRLEARPGEAAALLPILGVALRSVRGPERRAGLVAVVRLVERGGPEVGRLVRAAFPELICP